jgi:hypothetical protein
MPVSPGWRATSGGGGGSGGSGGASLDLVEQVIGCDAGQSPAKNKWKNRTVAERRPEEFAALHTIWCVACAFSFAWRVACVPRALAAGQRFFFCGLQKNT